MRLGNETLSLKPKASIDTAPHLIVEAYAGCGKTTTLIEGLKVLKGVGSTLTPSPQQQAIWDSMAQSSGKAESIGFVAFNKSIAEELKARVPVGIEAMTMHSLGFAAVRKAFPRLKVNNYRVQDLISTILKQDIRELRKSKPVVIKATEELVGLCKMNLVGNVKTPPSAHELWDLADYYSVDLDRFRSEIFDLVPYVLQGCLDPSRDGSIDFDDMIYLPVALSLKVRPYDLLLVDERQDLNKCQQQLATMSGTRIIAVGDAKQSIMGFAGADAKACENLHELLEAHGTRGVETLPLTITRRCGRAIVNQAQRYVPSFEAHESNSDGMVDELTYPTDKEGFPRPEPHYMEKVQDGDFILCRTNAPLVRECFRFIKMGRKANIQGRDVAKGLISTVEKMKATTVPSLIQHLSDWHHQEIQKEQAKRNPSETKMQGLDDRLECLLCFCESATSPEDVVRKIEAIFTDDKNNRGIRLSSIHRAKGLESHRVFFLKPPTAKIRTDKMQDWELDQLDNLEYVGITRAANELYYVR